MARLVLLTVSLVALASCNEPNPEFCKNLKNADDPFCKMGGACTANSSCTSTPKFPVCDLTDNGGTCVLCTADDHAQCTGMTPHCEDHACVACVDDNDCGAQGVGVCMPTGGCADPNSIIHAVSSGGVGTSTCGAMGAGNACKLDTALSMVKTSPTKNVIKLDDAGPYISELNNFVVDVDAAVGLTIDARGATLHRNNDGPILTINGGRGVTILGGTIEGANASGGDGIRCDSNATLTVDGTTLRMNDESAIEASGCTLTVTNAMIRSNSKPGTGPLYPGIQVAGGSITISRSWIVSNRGGGIVLSSNGVFQVVGNVFLGNGDILGAAGGVSVSTTTPGNRLEFNTIVENKSQGGIAAGVQCTATAGFAAQNNIIWNNNSLLGSGGIQVSGGCQHGYSDIGPAAVPGGNDGGNNMSSDPSFVDALTDPHLKLGSTVRQHASRTADLTGIASKDIDGDVRILQADLGADQVK